jgi:hypothetical protein
MAVAAIAAPMMSAVATTKWMPSAFILNKPNVKITATDSQIVQVEMVFATSLVIYVSRMPESCRFGAFAVANHHLAAGFDQSPRKETMSRTVQIACDRCSTPISDNFSIIMLGVGDLSKTRQANSANRAAWRTICFFGYWREVLIMLCTHTTKFRRRWSAARLSVGFRRLLGGNHDTKT